MPGGSSMPSSTSVGGMANPYRIMFCRPAWAFGVSTPRKPLIRPYSFSNASPISSWIILGLRFIVSRSAAVEVVNGAPGAVAASGSTSRLKVSDVS